MKSNKSMGEKIFTCFLVTVIIALLFFLVLYILQQTCLNDCCKEAGGMSVKDGVCVDVNGDRISSSSSCHDSCEFWRW